MLVRKVTVEQIERAFARVNRDWQTCVKPYAGGWGSSRAAITPVGRGYRFTLRLTDSKAPFHRRAQQRYRSTSAPKRMPSVCWHGHKAFMLALFMEQPDAVIITGMARYNGLAGFTREHEATYERNIGSQMMPQAYGDACDCAQDNTDERVDLYLMAEASMQHAARALLAGPVDDAVGTEDARVEDVHVPDVSEARWAEYNRKFNALLMRGEGK